MVMVFHFIVILSFFVVNIPVNQFLVRQDENPNSLMVFYKKTFMLLPKRIDKYYFLVHLNATTVLILVLVVFYLF